MATVLLLSDIAVAGNLDHTCRRSRHEFRSPPGACFQIQGAVSTIVVLCCGDVVVMPLTTRVLLTKRNNNNSPNNK